jgi:redox-sensitive bicupin YhaK (pirin superfamily)
MNTLLISASSRGHVDHGWLDTYHTFSFASYHDPNRMHFGALRVLNDDIVLPKEGFGTHPHDNMEIISIPLYGSLAHKDSMGKAEVLNTGEVQVMSAGTGITHSEYNASEDKPLNFFQIWIFPDKQNVTPRYAHRKFDFTHSKNQFVQIVGPENDRANTGLWIHQAAWLNIGTFEKGKEIEYPLNGEGTGVFAMVIEGEFTVEEQRLHERDALCIWNTGHIKIVANTDDARILLIEVPLEF